MLQPNNKYNEAEALSLMAERFHDEDTISLGTITANGEETTGHDWSKYRYVSIQPVVTFNGTYSNESITLKLKASNNGEDYFDTGVEITFTNSDTTGVVIARRFKHYKFAWTVGGDSPSYDVDVHCAFSD